MVPQAWPGRLTADVCWFLTLTLKWANNLGPRKQVIRFNSVTAAFHFIN
uniref:Uncharacterized protein n=1 Tax=Anguilla anguilla TaxID=7936 RepID=A0A0E9TTZ1_ANGAN